MKTCKVCGRPASQDLGGNIFTSSEVYPLLKDSKKAYQQEDICARCYVWALNIHIKQETK